MIAPYQQTPICQDGTTGQLFASVIAGVGVKTGVFRVFVAVSASGFASAELAGLEIGVVRCLLDKGNSVCKLVDMNTITMPIGEGRAQLCGLIKKVKAGAQVVLTNYGQPEVVICCYRPVGKRNRVAVPTPASHFGDIQSPVIEDWK